MKPKLYLIPNLLGSDGKLNKALPSYNLEVIQSLNHFAVEHIKDCRRFFVRCGLKSKIDKSEFVELNKRSDENQFAEITKWMNAGHSVGIVSDAGCPGIADPGSKLVQWAHENRFPVEPLIGPSSILLALIGSGMNGQSFSFHGYLDRDGNQRKKQVQQMEVHCKQQTQLFMETPYRNEALMEDLLKYLHPNTSLCVAVDLSLASEEIRRASIAEWRKMKIKLHKRPAIFLIGQ
ncbi:MAG: SAM-dependent methyltransferase [Vicingaceae bacterium]